MMKLDDGINTIFFFSVLSFVIIIYPSDGLWIRDKQHRSFMAPTAEAK